LYQIVKSAIRKSINSPILCCLSLLEGHSTYLAIVENLKKQLALP